MEHMKMMIAEIDVIQVGSSDNESGMIRQKHQQQMAEQKELGYSGFRR